MEERKSAERERARAARKAIPPEERARKAERIRDLALKVPEVESALVVGAYVSVHSEVDTRGVIEALFAREARVAVPVVTPPETMRFAELSSLDELAPGAHGIPEPRAPRTFLDDVDALLVPGLLFTPRGERLGNGGGYFDRVLRAMPHAFRVGLAFEEQVVRELPVESHDERMDALVTDERVRRFPPRPR